MGGTSHNEQKTVQESQLTPYQPAQAGLNGILNNLQPSVDTLAGTPQTEQAFGQLMANAQAGNPYAGAVGDVAKAQLAGGPNYGTASGILGKSYGDLQTQLSPYTSGNAMNPETNPALAQMLATVRQQVGDQVNSTFAAAGRPGSGYNGQELARGITLGSTPLLLGAQANQLGAINNLFAGGQQTAHGYSALDTNNANIQNSGVNNAGQAWQANQLAPQQLLQTALARQQLPMQNAGLLSSIYGPLAAQFGQNNGTSSTTASQTMSPMQQALMATQMMSNLGFKWGGGGGGSPASIDAGGKAAFIPGVS